MTTLRPVSEHSLADRVAEELRRAIQNGELRPRTPLVERRLASDLGVSHIPVREALMRLVEEGLVERRPRRTARVAELTPQMLVEVSSLRVVLEQLVAERVQERWTADVESELLELVDAMVAAARLGDVTRVYDLDERFHGTLWQLADHALLLEVSTQLRGRIRRFLVAAAENLDRAELVAHAETHRELVDVLAAGTPAAARRAMRRHIEIAADRIALSLGGDA